MQTTLIHPARASDLPRIQTLAHAIWPVAYKDILSAAQLDYMLGLFYSIESLEEQVAKGDCFFVMETAGNAVGFAATAPVENGIWKLQKLYVLSQYQGLGLGKALLNHIEAFARTHDAIALTLQVNRANSAVSFYQNNGFKIADTKDFDIGNGFFMNDFIMEKHF